MELTRHMVRLLAVTAALCCEAPSNRSQGTEMDLVLSMFSGRPDPSVRLSAAKADEILQAAGLLPITSDEPLPDGLGYRGFVLRPAGQSGARERLRVFRDLVWDGQVTRRDSSR